MLLNYNLTGMIIEKYGVTLRRLSHDRIEMVRTWRNDPSISQFMEFRDYITPQMQEQWFEKINNEQNCFFIVEVENEPVGVVNMKNINWEQGVGESGIYIYNSGFPVSYAGQRSMFAMCDYFFEERNFSCISAHILEDNDRSFRLHEKIGYKMISGQENVRNKCYMLSREDYMRNRDREIRKL